jgi:hypothetical protein
MSERRREIQAANFRNGTVAARLKECCYMPTEDDIIDQTAAERMILHAPYKQSICGSMEDHRPVCKISMGKELK